MHRDCARAAGMRLSANRTARLKCTDGLSRPSGVASTPSISSAAQGTDVIRVLGAELQCSDCTAPFTIRALLLCTGELRRGGKEHPGLVSAAQEASRAEATVPGGCCAPVPLLCRSRRVESRTLKCSGHTWRSTLTVLGAVLSIGGTAHAVGPRACVCSWALQLGLALDLLHSSLPGEVCSHSYFRTKISRVPHCR